MNATDKAPCDDYLMRLSIYEAGHALVAWYLGHKIHHVRMLPRPCTTVTDKAFVGNNWASFSEVLEFRAMELFGGQIAEQIICKTPSCCEGDIPRIDEICRILGGLHEAEDHDDIFFRLEDDATEIFADERYREAIVPVARVLYDHETAGEAEISGEDIEAEIEKFIPRPAAPTTKERLFAWLRAS